MASSRTLPPPLGPPPLPGKPPNVGSNTPAKQNSKSSQNNKGKDQGGGRNELLNQIQKGSKLKKAVTNDRSAPNLGAATQRSPNPPIMAKQVVDYRKNIEKPNTPSYGHIPPKQKIDWETLGSAVSVAEVVQSNNKSVFYGNARRTKTLDPPIINRSSDVKTKPIPKSPPQIFNRPPPIIDNKKPNFAPSVAPIRVFNTMDPGKNQVNNPTNGPSQINPHPPKPTRVPPPPPPSRSRPPGSSAPPPPGRIQQAPAPIQDDEESSFANRFQWNINIPPPDPYQNLQKVYQSLKHSSRSEIGRSMISSVSSEPTQIRRTPMGPPSRPAPPPPKV